MHIHPYNFTQCKMNVSMDIAGYWALRDTIRQKQTYRGMFETQKFGNKTSSGEIGLKNRALASPKSGVGPGVRRNKRPLGMPHPLQMFYGNLSQLGKKSNSVIRSRSVIGSKIGVMPGQWRMSLKMVIIQNAV